MRIVKIKKRVACFLWVFAIAFLLTVGCTANKTKPDSELVSPDGIAGEAMSSVELISVVRMGDAVLIEADGPFKYTSFRLAGPSRVIIDLPSVSIDKVQSPIDVNNDYITNITTSFYGDGEDLIGRIEVGLHEGVDYEVKAGEDSLLIVLSGIAEDTKGADSAALEDSGLGPWDLESEGEQEIIDGFSMLDGEDLDSEYDEAQVVLMQPATTVVDLKLASDDEKTVVRIITDGEVGNYNAFALDDPTRVVVDIWGIDSSLYDDTVKVDSEILERVRLGTHDDKVRFVFDSSGVEVPYYSVRKDGDSLVVTLSSKPLSEPQEDSFVIAGLEKATTEDSNPWNLPIEEAAEVAEEAGEEDQAMKEAGGEPVELPTAPAAQVAVVPTEEVVEIVESAPLAPASEVVEASTEPESDLLSEVLPPEVLPDDFEGQEDLELAEIEAGEEEAQESAQSSKTVPASKAIPAAATTLGQKASVDQDLNVIVRKDSVDVENVEFRLMGDVARLAITNSDVAKFRVKESKDGKVLSLDIFNAFIPDNLQSTLDAGALDSPVVTISSYQAHTDPVGNVRVVVKLNARVSYDISRSGNVINMDFPLMTWVEDDRANAESDIEGLDEEIAFSEEEDDFDIDTKEETSDLRYTGRKINIDMVDAEVTDMLKLLAEVSDLNIIASGEVAGKITLRLKNVPWDQAFDLILKTRGLGSIQEGNVVRVAPAARIREEREGALAAKKAATKLEDVKTEYIRINYDKAASLSVQLETLLSDRGSIIVHKPTNTIVVRDISIAIEDVKSYIKKVDIPIAQVLIEARIVEATSSFARDLGVQWGVDIQSVGNQMTTSSFGSVDEKFGQWAANPSQQTGTIVSGGAVNVDKKGFLAQAGVTNYAVNLPATGTAGTLGALGFILGKTGANPMILDLRISAGEQQGLVKTISRPRIITMNNKEAKIEQGESIPFETATVEGTATTFIDANLSLTVTPQITPDGSVLMAIKATRNSIGSFRNSIGEPSINTKEASTHVLVRNGETTVMGGIIVSDTNSSERGIPYLKEIPFLGWLFKAKSISDSQTELLIFITPTILESGGEEG